MSSSGSGPGEVHDPLIQNPVPAGDGPAQSGAGVAPALDPNDPKNILKSSDSGPNIPQDPPTGD